MWQPNKNTSPPHPSLSIQWMYVPRGVFRISSGWVQFSILLANRTHFAPLKQEHHDRIAKKPCVKKGFLKLMGAIEPIAPL